jgi:hypothetical protein
MPDRLGQNYHTRCDGEYSPRERLAT